MNNVVPKFVQSDSAHVIKAKCVPYKNAMMRKRQISDCGR